MRLILEILKFFDYLARSFEMSVAFSVNRKLIVRLSELTRKQTEFQASFMFRARQRLMSIVSLKYRTFDAPPIKLSKSVILACLPKETGPVVWGDICEILHEKQKNGESLKQQKQWLWKQTAISIWPSIEWRARLLVERLLKIVGMSQAVEWLFSKF